MPIEVKRFRCIGHGCRHVRADVQLIVTHEKTCWKNPANKTCLTCKHHELVKDSDGSGHNWRYHNCNHPTFEAPQLDWDNRVDGEEMPRPVVNCQFWEA